MLQRPLGSGHDDDDDDVSGDADDEEPAGLSSGKKSAQRTFLRMYKMGVRAGPPRPLSLGKEC